MSDATLTDGWYVSREHEMLGPLSDAELRNRVHQGGISASDYVWRDGQELWVQVSDMAALKAAIRASSPAGHEQMRADARAEHTRRDDAQRGARQKQPAQKPPKVSLPKMPNWSAPSSPARSDRAPPAGNAPSAPPAPTLPNAAEAGEMAMKKLRELVKNPGQLAGILFVAGILIPPLLLPLWVAAWLVWTKLRKA